VSVSAASQSKLLLEVIELAALAELLATALVAALALGDAVALP